MKYLSAILLVIALLPSCNVFKKSGDDDDNDTPATTVGIISGTSQVPYCDTDGQVGCITTEDFKAADLRSITIGSYSSGVTVGGVTIDACSSSGQADCIATSALPAVDSTELDPAVIADGVTIGGVEGSALVGFNTNISSFVHRDKTETQISLADEIALGPDAAIPGNVREVPVVAKDDYGIPPTAAYEASRASVNPVTRDNNADHTLRDEWEEDGSLKERRVCGMGLTTIAAKITSCFDVHNTNGDIPGWDAGVSGRISWNGSVQGNASEGSWTLVAIYADSQTNGTICNGFACQELWRDDRTGLLWSDRLGDLTQVETAVRNKFSWCLAAGNTENDGGIDCIPGVGHETGYNEFQDLVGPPVYSGISLCTEVGTMLTPVGTGTTTLTAGLDPWDNSGTDIIDAKGGLDLSSSPKVRWRLPTVQDLAQAFIVNGGYYVLPNMYQSPWNYWSSSVRADNRNSAWLFNGNFGSIPSGSRDLDYAVRCVGR